MVFGFFGTSGITGQRQNLPRVRIAELSSRQFDSTIVQEFSTKVFFIGSHPEIENNAVSMMGLRCRRLFMEGERVLAIVLNLMRSSYGKTGIFCAELFTLMINLF